VAPELEALDGVLSHAPDRDGAEALIAFALAGSR
jgi:hypothetical protein